MKASRIFLQAAVAFMGLGALALMLWVPPHEGRNADAALSAVYFKDPFLAYVYLGSLPFFYALFQAFKVLGYIGRNEAFSPNTVKALRTIRRCALATAGLAAGAVISIRVTAGPAEDPAGFVMPGVFAVFASLAAASAATVLENIVGSGLEKRSER